MSQSRIKKVVEELLAVEAAVDVNALSFGGLKLWPLIRRMHHFTRVQKDPNQPTKLEDINSETSPVLGLEWSGCHIDRPKTRDWQCQVMSGEEKADVIFVSRLLDHTDLMNGLPYNRLIDPWLHECRKQIKALKIEFFESGQEFSDERFEPTYGYELPPWENDELMRGMPSEVEGFGPVIEVFRRVSDRPPTFKGISSYLPRLWARKKTFSELLVRLKPKLVCVICYYSTDMFALVWACRDLGIPIADIQHGQQGAYHSLYNHWTVSPKNGYDLVPDFFLCWNERIRAMQQETVPDPEHRPHSIVTGNAWVDLWSQGGPLKVSKEMQSFIDSYSARKTVLVGLQPKEDFFPDNLPSAMRRTPDWLWLLRVHPHQRYRIPEIKVFLSAAGLENFEIDHSTHAPLYALLRSVSHVVTPFSSLALEADQFGCPVTIIDPDGLEAYEPEISKGIFGYAVKPKDIISSIADRSRPEYTMISQQEFLRDRVQVLADICDRTL
ncbi:MAG: hypothetical protein RIF37_07465 [Rhodospirillaceae bacterium]